MGDAAAMAELAAAARSACLSDPRAPLTFEQTAIVIAELLARETRLADALIVWPRAE